MHKMPRLSCFLIAPRFGVAFALPRPGPGEIHLWAAFLPDFGGTWHGFEKALARSEILGVNRFRNPEDRLRAVVSRAVLRLLLGRYTLQGPHSVRLVNGKNGKPALAGSPAGGALSFNVSHSGDYILWAFSGYGDTGVDIERIRHIEEMEAIAAMWFHPAERRQLARRSRGKQKAVFYDLWTRKEAYVKATGQGLLRSPASFCVCGAGEGVAGFGVEDSLGAGAKVRAALALSLFPGHAAAVVCI